MVSPIANDPLVGSGLDNDTATTLVYNLKIGNNSLSNCRFYASMYTFTPQAETEYISSPERTILYNDCVQYVLPNISPNASVNSLITSGIARTDIRSLPFSYPKMYAFLPFFFFVDQAYI